MVILNILLLSFVFGISMKIADLLNEHGLSLFKGANIIFGFLWGGIGSFLITQNQIVANIYIAIIIAYIFRAKIDYINHGIGSCMMLFTFLYQLNNGAINIDWNILLIFSFVLTISGLIHDWLIGNNKLNLKLGELLHTGIFYTIVPFIYSFLAKSWVVFLSLFTFGIGYELTRFLGTRIIISQKSKR
jgi:hypothetical protein